MTEWWSAQSSGLVHALGGILGALCGVLGALSGVLAPRGKGKALIVAGFVLFGLVGLGSLAASIVALAQGQPYHVWYPLLLGGALFSILPSVLLPVVLMRYRQAEARRMEAEELRRT